MDPTPIPPISPPGSAPQYPAKKGAEGGAGAGTGEIAETLLAEALGLSRGDLKKLREEMLTKWEDWFALPGKPVMITAGGRAKIAAHLEKKAGAPAADANEAGPVDELEAAVREIEKQWLHETLNVTALTRNKGILLAVNAAGVEVRCQVRSNENFRAGMVMERCRKDGPTLYTYQGRLPRRKGRWR